MFGEIIGAISNFMYSYLLIIMLIGVGLYYTLRTRLVQVRMFKETIRVIWRSLLNPVRYHPSRL